MQVKIKTKENVEEPKELMERVFDERLYFMNDFEDLKVRTQPVKAKDPKNDSFEAFAKADGAEYAIPNNGSLVLNTLEMGREISKAEYEAS